MPEKLKIQDFCLSSGNSQNLSKVRVLTNIYGMLTVHLALHQTWDIYLTSFNLKQPYEIFPLIILINKEIVRLRTLDTNKWLIWDLNLNPLL